MNGVSAKVFGVDEHVEMLQVLELQQANRQRTNAFKVLHVHLIFALITMDSFNCLRVLNLNGIQITAFQILELRSH